jgi:hypothetical protein
MEATAPQNSDISTVNLVYLNNALFLLHLLTHFLSQFLPTLLRGFAPISWMGQQGLREGSDFSRVTGKIVIPHDPIPV